MNPHGSKWIHPEKRIRIYERDNWRCVWCLVALFDALPGYRTLDHVIPRCKGGGNDANNLVTCCVSCNSTRQNMIAVQFSYIIAKRTGTKAVGVLSRVLQAVCKDLPKQLTLVVPAIDSDAE